MLQTTQILTCLALDALGTESFSILGTTGSAVAGLFSISTTGPDFECAFKKSVELGRGAGGGAYVNWRYWVTFILYWEV